MSEKLPRNWTAAELAMLGEMHRAGKSGSQIAHALGTGKTRCAVIGMIDRRLRGKVKVDVPRAPSRPPKAVMAPRPIKTAATPEPVQEPDGVRFLDRRHDQCARLLPREPGSSILGAMVCGQPVRGESSWCPACAAVLTRTETRNEKFDLRKMEKAA